MARLKASERREQLMTVATRLFSQKGYDATTTAAIAEAAGITEPVLYRHFENKKDLFIGVLRACTDLLISRWRSSAERSEAATDQVRGIAQSVHSALPEISDAQRVVYSAASTSCDPEVRAVLRAHALKFYELARQIIVNGQKRGEFRTDLDVDAMSWALVNVYTGFSFTRLNFESPFGMDLRVGIELILTGLRVTGGPDKPASEPQS